MIPRYARAEMTAIWSPETKFRIWFEIEAHAADALADLGVIPKEAAAKVWDLGAKATFDVERIDEIERETRHDVIAFLRAILEAGGKRVHTYTSPHLVRINERFRLGAPGGAYLVVISLMAVVKSSKE